MGIRKGYVVMFTPQGLCDAADSSFSFEGACTSLQDLMFDPSNPGFVIPRPGIGTALTSFGGFSAPGFISVQVVINGLVYGMIASSKNAGKDEPFCYNIAGAAFIAMGGTVTVATCPTSPATTGAWTPPTMAQVGTKIIITHPGYGGGAGDFFGMIDISNPAAPTYNHFNTVTNLLPSVPLSVATFNNRAYYATGNVLWFSDVLVPGTITNATQSLTVGDSSPIIGMSGQPLETSSSGTIPGLIVFKQNSIWQVTGDSTTNNLTLSFITLTVGTLAGRSIASSPFGVFFAGADGPYLVTQRPIVVPVTNAFGDGGIPDVTSVFRDPNLVPSRIAGAYGQNLYRLTMTPTGGAFTYQREYCFDTRRNRWTGPNKLYYDTISPTSTSFIISSYSPPTSPANRLFASPTNYSATAITDDGVPVSPLMISSALPKQARMTVKQVVETTVELVSPGSGTQAYSVLALDETGIAISSTSIVAGNYGGVNGASTPYKVPWTKPLVFKKIEIEVAPVLSSGYAPGIGTVFLRYQDAGYESIF